MNFLLSASLPSFPSHSSPISFKRSSPPNLASSSSLSNTHQCLPSNPHFLWPHQATEEVIGWACPTALPVRFMSLWGQCSLGKPQLFFVEWKLRATMAGTWLVFVFWLVWFVMNYRFFRVVFRTIGYVCCVVKKLKCWLISDGEKNIACFWISRLS